MEIDIEKIRKRISEINEAIEKVDRYASVPDQELWRDERNILAVKHLLLEVIEACGSICLHIAAKRFFAVPSSCAECFESLRKSNVIDDELTSKLVRMARFRNILVHRYREIDDREIGFQIFEPVAYSADRIEAWRNTAKAYTGGKPAEREWEYFKARATGKPC